MNNVISLPAPQEGTAGSIESALSARRSVRTFGNQPLTLADVAQILWAAQGVTHPSGYRTVPSAGGLFPLELHVVVGHVQGLKTGVYRYVPHQHALLLRGRGDGRAALSEAALGQDWMAGSAAIIVIAADYSRTTGKYGERGIPYVHMEVGAAAQNIQLQAAARGLGAVFVGAFDDDQVCYVLGLPPDEHPLALLPVGVRTITRP